jgi:Caspase domain
MMDFLSYKFHAPSSHILFLADERATRSAILNGFQHHLIENNNIERGDAMVIFYAGHGSRTDAPNGWFADYVKVETICPHDQGSIGDNHKEIFGIPDRTFGGLLRRLAATKGDNIVRIAHHPAVSSS